MRKIVARTGIPDAHFLPEVQDLKRKLAKEFKTEIRKIEQYENLMT